MMDAKDWYARLRRITETMAENIEKAPEELTEEDVDMCSRYLNARGFLTVKDSDAQNAHRALARRIAEHIHGTARKGLWLWGLPGRGKSRYLELFCTDIIPRCPVMSAMDVYSTYQTLGIPGVVGNLYQEYAYDVAPDGYHAMGIDDVGIEPLGRRYGEVLEVMAVVIDERYRHWQRRGYAGMTIFTSNLSPLDVRERYGVRSASRLAEMCESIELTGPDWRLAL